MGFSLGIRSNDLGRFETIDEFSAAAAATGASSIHLVHYKTIADAPSPLTDEWCDKLYDSLQRNKMKVVLLSGSCNPVHPDEGEREKGILKAIDSICHAPLLGYPIVTTESGSIDPRGNVRHSENHTEKTWSTLLRAVERILEKAEEKKVIFSIEPCADKNVASTPEETLRLMEEFRSPYLKVLFDAVNIMPPEGLRDYAAFYDEAVDMLKPYIAALHFKDFVFTDDNSEFPFTEGPVKHVVPAGFGLFPWNDVIPLYRKHGLLDLPATLESAEKETLGESLSYIDSLASIN